jgi:hypothetical protein
MGKMELRGIELAMSASAALYIAKMGGGYKTNASACDEALRQQSGRVSVSRDMVLSRLEKVGDSRMVLNCVTRIPAPAGPLLLAMCGMADSKTLARTMAALLGYAGQDVAERQVLGYMSPGGYGKGRPPLCRRHIEDELDRLLYVADAAICERYPWVNEN